MNGFFGPARGRRTGALVIGALATVLTLGACSGPSATSSSGAGGATAVAPSSGAPSAQKDSLGGEAASPAAPDAATHGATTSTVQKLIVVNKTVRIEAKDVDASITRIRALAAADGGDIASMQVSTSTDEPVYPAPLGTDAAGSDSADRSVPLRAFVIVRVPSTKYGAFVAEVAKLGRVLYQSESADDVTQQHVDMQARLGNLKAEQKRLRQLFARAANVRDMLSIEQELTRVQGDIESLQAQISYLEKQAAFATVTIELAEPQPIVTPSGTDWGVGTALTGSIRAFVDTMNAIIVVLGPVLALLVFVGLPVLVVVWLVRRFLRRRQSALEAAMAAQTAAPATPASDHGERS